MTPKPIALALTLALFFLIGCDNDGQAIRLRYEAEQRYFKANKELGLLTARPEMVTTEKIRDIAYQFRDLSQFCYTASGAIDASRHSVESREIHNIAYQSASRLAQLYFSAGLFDSCVSGLQRLVDNVSMTPSQARETYLNLGQALQSNKQWDSALTVYETAVLDFYPPLDSTGQIVFSVFNLPTHIFRLAVFVTDSATSQGQLTSAINYYQRFIREHPETRLAAASHANLARLYDDIGRWEFVIPELAALKDSTGKLPAETRIRVADVFATRLNQNDRAIAIYDSLLLDTPEADTVLRPLLIFKKATSRIEQKQYAEGRDLLVDLKKNYLRFYRQNPSAQLAIARSFELEGNWGRAEAEYQVLFKNFKGSDEGMKAYLHVADRFAKMGRTAEAEHWYTDALTHYEEIATRGAGTLVEASALYFKASLYEQRRDWKQAVTVLETAFTKFPDSDLGRTAITRAAQITRNEMRDSAAAALLDQKLKTAVSKMRQEWEN